MVIYCDYMLDVELLLFDEVYFDVSGFECC